MIKNVSIYYDIQFINRYWVVYKCSFSDLNALSLLNRQILEHFTNYDDALKYVKAIDDELAFE